MTARKQPAARAGEASSQSARKKDERKKGAKKAPCPFAAPEDGDIQKLVQDALRSSMTDMKEAAVLFTVAARKGYLPAYMLLVEKAKEHDDEDLVVDTIFRLLGSSDVSEHFPEDMLGAYAQQLSMTMAKAKYKERVVDRAEEIAKLAQTWPQQLQFLKLHAENLKLQQSGPAADGEKEAREANDAIQQQQPWEQPQQQPQQRAEPNAKLEMSLEVKETWESIRNILKTQQAASKAHREAEAAANLTASQLAAVTASAGKGQGADAGTTMDDSTKDVLSKVKSALSTRVDGECSSDVKMDDETAKVLSNIRDAMGKPKANVDGTSEPLKSNETTEAIFGQVRTAIQQCQGGEADAGSSAPTPMDEATADVFSKVQALNAHEGEGGSKSDSPKLSMDDSHSSVVSSVKQALDTVAKTSKPTMTDSTADVFKHVQKAVSQAPASQAPAPAMDGGTAGVLDQVQKALKMEQDSLSKEAALQREKDAKSKKNFSMLNAGNPAPATKAPPAAPPAAHHPFAWRRSDTSWDFCAEVPHMTCLSEGTLDVSAKGIMLTLPNGEIFINELPPRDSQLDPEGAHATWSKKAQTLTVSFPVKTVLESGAGGEPADEAGELGLD